MKFAWITALVFFTLFGSVAQAQAVPLRGVGIGPEG